MIKSYSQYINHYLNKKNLNDRAIPGEHHFVSAYLVPKLFSITNRIPDYINPDGTKNIKGDVVYYQGDEHQFGIEVKLGIVRLTKGEFNDWVVGTDQSKWPQLFIAIDEKGLVMCSWQEFRVAYIRSIKDKKPNWEPNVIERGYGPLKVINLLRNQLPSDKNYPYGKHEKVADSEEQRFIERLELELKL